LHSIYGGVKILALDLWGDEILPMICMGGWIYFARKGAAGEFFIVMYGKSRKELWGVEKFYASFMGGQKY
jgi:hypothetical protein